MTLIKFEWEKEWRRMVLWLFVIGLILVLFMSFYPTMLNGAMKDIVTDKMDALPENILKVFHLEDGKSLLELPGYFAYVFQYIFIAVCIFSVIISGQSLIGEETDGTIEFLYAQPISRKNLFLGKYVANGLLLTLLWLLLFGLSCLLCLFVKSNGYDISLFVKVIGKVFLNEFTVLILFYHIGMLASTILKSSKQVISLAMGLVFGTFMLGIFGGLDSKMSWVQNFSPIQLATPSLMLNENLKLVTILILLGLSLFIFVLSLTIYRKKDFNL